MSETLGDKRRRFTRGIAELISWCQTQGYEVATEEWKRSDEQAEINALGSFGRARLAKLIGADMEFARLAKCILNNGGSGIRNSLHELGLAVDLNLYKNDAWFSKSEHHRFLGEKWESMGIDHRWGGRWGDGNHYSLEHQGRK